MFSSPLFRGERLRLAAPLPEDAAQFTAWSTDADYLRLLDDDPIFPAGPAYFAHFNESPRSNHPDSFYFHLRTLDDDTLIGFVVLFNLKWRNGSAEMAIGIGDPAYRGRGYGAEALRLLLGYAFSELNLYRVELTVMAYNTAAIRAYERVGFVREGVKRGAVWRDGQRHDLLAYAILREEWAALQAG